MPGWSPRGPDQEWTSADDVDVWVSHSELGLAHLVTRWQHGYSSPKCGVIEYGVKNEDIKGKPKCGLCKEVENE